jgi:hypothetical protein
LLKAVKGILFGICFVFFAMLTDDVWRKYNLELSTTGLQKNFRLSGPVFATPRKLNWGQAHLTR